MDDQPNYDPVTKELQPNTATTVDLDWPGIIILTDRDLSMLGEAKHKTIGGKGIVGRLITKRISR